MASPRPAMNWNGHKDHAEISCGIQLLKAYVQRLALRATRLFVLPNPGHIEILGNRLIQDTVRDLDILRVNIQLDSAHQVRPEPVQPHNVFVSENGVNAR